MKIEFCISHGPHVCAPCQVSVLQKGSILFPFMLEFVLNSSEGKSLSGYPRQPLSLSLCNFHLLSTLSLKQFFIGKLFAFSAASNLPYLHEQ